MDNKELRNRIIKYGVDNNILPADINKALAKKKLAPYNPLTHLPNYQQMGERFWQQGKEFGRDLGTFGGMVIKPIVSAGDKVYKAPMGKKVETLKQETKKIVNNPTIQRIAKGAGAGALVGNIVPGIGALPGAFLGGVVAGVGPKETVNSILKTYNTDIDKLKAGKTKLEDVVQGVQRNPLYATMDLFPVGAKAVKGGINKIGKAVPKDAPIALQQVLPSKELRQVNRDITEALGASRVKSSNLYNAYSALEALPNTNKEQLVNYIRTGKGKLKGNELSLAKALRNDLVVNQKKAIELGFVTEEATKNDVIAQYVMHHISNKSNLLHMDVRDIISGGKLQKRTRDILKEEGILKEVKDLAKKGEELYNKDKIALLTQKLASSEDPLGNIIASDLNAGAKGYFDTSRIIGRTGAKDLGNVLEDSIKFQLDQVGHSREGLDILDRVINNPELVNMISGERKANIVDSFKKSLIDDFNRGELPDLNKALQSSKIGKDMPKIYYTALNNAFKKPLNTGWRRLLNAFKKAVLGQPHWVALNRAGNWTNNAMEGVTFRDYLDTRKYKDLAPRQLKLQTSFSSYINEGIQDASDASKIVKPSAMSAVQIPINRLGKSWRKFKAGDKSLENIGEFAKELYSNTSDITSNPWFRLESNLEFTDRYANFIRQAKREAEATGKNIKTILKRANEDQALFNKLNSEVNKSLGDYVGRNYAMPAGAYNILSEAIPFYRFLTQTGRTTAHQLANKPLAFASLTSIPSRISNPISEQVIRQYNLDPEKYKGGIPYLEQNGNIRTLGYEPLPVGSVLDQIGNWMQGKELTTGLNPAISSLPDVLKFRKFDKLATTPNNPMGNQDYTPTANDIQRYGLSAFLGNTYNPYIMATRYAPELLETIAGYNQGNNILGNFGFGTGLQSRYDTNPFTINPASYNRDLPSELVEKWFGVKSSSNYPVRRKSKSQIKKEIRKQQYYKQRVKNAKKNKRSI